MLDLDLLAYMMENSDQFGSILIENFDAHAYADAIAQQIEMENLTMENQENAFPFQELEGEQLSFFDDLEIDGEEIDNNLENDGPVLGE